MFGRKKDPAPPPPKKKSSGAALMAQMGMGMDIDASVYGELEGDEELEAELRALQDDYEPGAKINRRDNKQKGNMKSILELDKMIADCTRDISDDEVSDTEDPELLAELEAIDSDDDEPQQHTFPSAAAVGRPVASVSPSTSTTAAQLQERLGMYQQAHASATACNDTMKARRLERGLQKLEGLVKQAKAGKPIPEDEIPPVVAIGPSKPPPTGGLTQVEQPTIDGPLQLARPAPQRPTVQDIPTSPPHAAVSTQPLVAHSALIPVVSPVVEPVPKLRAVIQPVQVAQAVPAISPVSVARSPALTVVMNPATTPAVPDHGQKELLVTRRDEYKAAALKAKQGGDTAAAMEYMKTYKQFEAVLQAVEQGTPVDLSKLPPSPHAEPIVQAKPVSQVVTIQREAKQGSEEEPLPELTNEDKQKLFKAPEKAGTIMEALQQRLEKYKEGEDQAKQELNSGKVKRMGRIVKQYEDAIKLHRAGKPLDLEELPCPPGYPPFPVEAGNKVSAVSSPANTAALKVSSGPDISPAATGSAAAEHPRVAPKPSLQKQASVLHSRSEQQTVFLVQRQTQFKQAAMSAKSSGDIELAKKYLRMAKGFDQMIEASRSGLPVDLSQVPAPPSDNSSSGFEIVNSPDVQMSDVESSDRASVYKRLQEELVNQIKMSESNRDHFTKLGDVSSATKFDKLCSSTRKDLDALKNAYVHEDPVPRFHYETRQFSLVQYCTDLGDNDLELAIVRGLNYNLPAGFSATDMNTFVKYDFPFPTETPQTGETPVCKGTSSPDYNQTFKLEVNRKSRALHRVLKSAKCCKLEVWYKRGFLKGDRVLGTVNIKLQPLEEKCVYHESYDLMDGRKIVGGKLEVKIRIREPYVSRQVEEVKEKWLVIDQFERRPAPKAVESKVINVKPAAESRPASLSVLRYERQLLDQQIEKYKLKLKPEELKGLHNKGQAIDHQATELGDRLKKGGASAYRAYADDIAQLQSVYLEEAKALAKQEANKEKIQMVLTKKKLVDKEIETIRQRYPVT